MEITTKKSTRGFASMDREKQRQIASLGGRAAHASGNAHEFTSDEGRAAGQKRQLNARLNSPANANTGGTPTGRSTSSFARRTVDSSDGSAC